MAQVSSTRYLISISVWIGVFCVVIAEAKLFSKPNGARSRRANEVLTKPMFLFKEAKSTYINEEHEAEIIEQQQAYLNLLHDFEMKNDNAITRDSETAKIIMKMRGETLDDIRRIATERSKTKKRIKRDAVSIPSWKWPKCIIPYEWSNEVYEADIRPSMELIEEYSGFRFVEYNSSVPQLYDLGHNNRLKFVNYLGCWSYLGNTASDGQNISCCSGQICTHELGHAIGFVHQHQAQGRDNHVRINYENVMKGQKVNFYKYETEYTSTFGYYDLSSLMHYSFDAWSANNKPTITSLDPDLNYLEHYQDYSRYYYYWNEIEKSHNCTDYYCASSKPICVNGGILSVVNGSCACLCPEGLDPTNGCQNFLYYSGGGRGGRGHNRGHTGGGGGEGGGGRGGREGRGRRGGRGGRGGRGRRGGRGVSGRGSGGSSGGASSSTGGGSSTGTSSSYDTSSSGGAGPRGGPRGGRGRGRGRGGRGGCGGIYELNETHPQHILTQQFSEARDCIFLFKSPEGTSMQLDFNDFDVDCAHSVEIRHNLLGQPGKRFCRDNYTQTIESYWNSLYLAYWHTDGGQTGGQITGSVTLVSDATRCYTNQGKDYSYSGTVNYTKQMVSCLKWNEVQNCRFNRFADSEFDDDLDNNYCRNTGVGLRPWCYTNAETCERDYCDACGTHKCYDRTPIECQADIHKPEFCELNKDGFAHSNCRKSCNKCILPVLGGTPCMRPNEIPYANGPFPDKQSYFLGEQVKYMCFNSNDTRNRTCTTDGSWTDLGFVCGACPRGWLHVDGKCLMWVDETLNYTDAAARCQQLKSGATLVMTRTELQFNKTIKVIQMGMEDIRHAWIGLYRKPNTSTYKWVDNTSVNWTNWDPGADKTEDCVIIYYLTGRLDVGVWLDVPCHYKTTAVCEYQPGSSPLCADQISNCEDYIRDTPLLCEKQTLFRDANCKLSCGLCPQGQSPNECPNPGIPANSRVTIGRNEPLIKTGRVYEYECEEGFSLSRGDLIRACLNGGELTGQPPICLDSSKVPTPVNNVYIRSRDAISGGGYTYLSTNKEHEIRKAGKLSKWRIYSKANGKVLLQVWRPITVPSWKSKSNQTNRFRLVGQNLVDSTGTDRILTVEVDEAQMINVKEDDVLGISFPMKNYGQVPLSFCNEEYEPEHTKHFYYGKPRKLKFWKPGHSYKFDEIVSTCLVWSLNAFIGYGA